MPKLRYEIYFRITLGSCVRLTLGNYVIKPCKCDQKVTYLWHLEVTSVFRYKHYVRITLANCVRFTFGNYVIKPCKWDRKVT